MDSIIFFLAQTLGVGGMVAMLVSFQTNRKQKLLQLQILSCVFYIGQYLLLGAWSGCLMNLLALIRNVVYGRYQTVPKGLVILFCAAAVLPSVFALENPISLLPCLASLIFTIALASKNLTLVRVADLISCSLYLIYNILVGAYTAELGTVAEMLSTIIAMLRFDRPKISSKKSHQKTHQKAHTKSPRPHTRQSHTAPNCKAHSAHKK